jgi:hypothetical protein
MRTAEKIKESNRAGILDTVNAIRDHLQENPVETIDDVLRIVQHQAAGKRNHFGYSEFFERELTVRPIGFFDGDALHSFIEELREKKDIAEKDKAFALIQTLNYMSAKFNKSIKFVTEASDFFMKANLGIWHSQFLITCVFAIEAFVRLKVIKPDDSFEIICGIFENDLPPGMAIIPYKDKDKMEKEEAQQTEGKHYNLREMTDSEVRKMVGVIDEGIESLEKQLEKFSADSPKNKLLN